MSYSEREKQIAELRRQMMILEEENRIEKEKQKKAEREILMEKRREGGLPEIHFPKEERRYSMDYKKTFLEIKRVMDEQGISQEYGEFSGYFFLGENNDCLRIMRGELSKKRSNGYYSMVQFNDGPIFMITKLRIEQGEWGVEMHFSISSSCWYTIIIDENGWELTCIPPKGKSLRNKEEIEEQIVEVRSTDEWVKIIYHDTRDTARSVYEWNAHDYVIRDALGPDNGVERIIDGEYDEVDEDDNDIDSTELQRRF